MDITVTFVGNATTLISAGGLTLLTDPNFLHRGQRAYLGHGLVSRRQHTITKGRTTLTLTSVPGRHAPGWSQRLLPPVMGTMLEVAAGDGSPPRRLYISGDTLLVEELNEFPRGSTRSTWACCPSAAPGCRPAGGFRSD